MEKKFSLAYISSSSNETVNLTRDEFEHYTSQQTVIAKLLEIERTYSVACEAFVELEQLLNEIAIDQSVHRYPSAETRWKASGITIRLNLKVLNLLNAYRVYLEHTPRLLTHMCDKLPNIRHEFRHQERSKFAESIHYRIMSALRNMAQHYSLPIKTFTVSHSRKDNPQTETRSQAYFRTTIDPFIEVTEFVKSKKGRSETRSEVIQLGKEKLDLKMCVRVYVEKLSEIHEWLRKSTEGTTDQAKNAYEEMLGRLAVANGEAKVGCILFDHDNDPWDESYIGLDVATLLDKKRGEWTKLNRASRRTVSSQSVLNNDTFFTDDPSHWIDG